MMFTKLRNYDIRSLTLEEKLTTFGGSRKDIISDSELETLNKELHLFFDANKLLKVEECLKKGANINSLDDQGKTLVEKAVLKGRRRALKFLVDILNANINVINAEGNTLVHLASLKENSEILKYLYKKGLRFNRRNLTNKLPEDLSENKKIRELSKVLRYVSKESFDLSDVIPGLGKTVLEWSAEIGDSSFIKILKKRGIKLDSLNGRNETAMHTAARKGFLGYVLDLVKYGARVRFIGSQFKSPFEVCTDRKTANVLFREEYDDEARHLLRDNRQQPYEVGNIYDKCRLNCGHFFFIDDIVDRETLRIDKCPSCEFFVDTIYTYSIGDEAVVKTSFI